MHKFLVTVAGLIYLIAGAATAANARPVEKSAPKKIVISFAGDCTFGTVNSDSGPNRFPAVYARSEQYDYPFLLVQPYFAASNFSIVNFECTLTDANQTANKQWKFKGDASYASIFPKGSIDAVGLANNHSFDYLQAGFDDTVANFARAHVPVIYQNRPYVTTVKGVQLVLIADCTVVGENTTEIDGTPQRVLSEIKRYKKPSNIVIVFMHWGSELDTVPIQWQQDMGREFIDAGADAVVGAHPHVLQGIELYKGKFIAYSLGNFAFGGNSLARHPETVILNLSFESRNNRMTSSGVSIVPCLTTSSDEKNRAGILINNYQPKPVFGAEANKITAIILSRSAHLKYGIKSITNDSLISIVD